jgi:hypothetical protein
VRWVRHRAQRITYVILFGGVICRDSINIINMDIKGKYCVRACLNCIRLIYGEFNWRAAPMVGCLAKETHLTYPWSGQHICFVFRSLPLYMSAQGWDLSTIFTIFLSASRHYRIVTQIRQQSIFSHPFDLLFSKKSTSRHLRVLS